MAADKVISLRLIISRHERRLYTVIEGLRLHGFGFRKAQWSEGECCRLQKYSVGIVHVSGIFCWEAKDIGQHCSGNEDAEHNAQTAYSKTVERGPACLS